MKSTRSKIEKVKTLAAYLAPLSPQDAERATRFATGRSSRAGSDLEAQVGYSILLGALKDVAGASDKDVSASYLKHGDLGDVAEELLSAKKAQPLFEEPLTLADVTESFDRLRAAKGHGSLSVREAVVKSLLLRAAPTEAKYVVKVLSREMRTGVVQGLMVDAISAASSTPRDDVARAYMLLGDIGLVASAAARKTIGQVGLVAFRPVNFMLAEALATPAEIAEHFGKEVVAEYKYDGVRAQVHKLGSRVAVYSRRLEDVTRSFPEVSAMAAKSGLDFILDGEIVPFKDGRPLPFQLLQRRLRRIEDFAEAAENAPVEYFAFDILLEGSRELTSLPLSERRKLLRRACEGTGIRFAHSQSVETAGQIAAAFSESRGLGYEGLVLKDPASAYGMGKRGSAWVKLKEELDTIDAVIVAAEYGHGKRAGVISDYTFAVRDGDRLRTIGKAYSGLTDAEIAEMTERMKALTVDDRGYWRTVRPQVVVEVAFDSIQASKRHDSGYALRFPRIKRIRTDKGPEAADTLERVEKLFREQKLKLEERR